MRYLYCAYSGQLARRCVRENRGLHPLKFGTAKNTVDRRERMNKGWRLKHGYRGAFLAMCDGWDFPVPPLNAGDVSDDAVKKAAKKILGVWDFVKDLADEMKQWQSQHVPDHEQFESNGIGELRLIDAFRLDDVRGDLQGKDLLDTAVVVKVAQFALAELAREVGVI